MPSPACTVQDGASAPVATTNGVDVLDNGGVVTIQLVDLSAETWTPTITGTDDLVVKPTLTINATTKTATFTKPDGPWALIFQSQVDGGVDVNGDTQQTYTTTFGVYVKTASGDRLMASNERAEGSASFGWATKFNALARKIASATGNDSWQLGTDAAYTITGTSGTQVVELPAAFTAPRVYTAPTAPTDGMKFALDDVHKILVDSGNTLTLTTQGGTDHFFVGGADQGTSYLVPGSLFAGGVPTFRRRASTNSWHLA